MQFCSGAHVYANFFGVQLVVHPMEVSEDEKTKKRTTTAEKTNGFAIAASE